MNVGRFHAIQVLPKNTRYSIELWARSDKPGMKVEILTGSWEADKAAAAAYHTIGTYKPTETVASATANGTWQRISGHLSPSAQDRSLQLRFSGGPGMIYIDNTRIAANATESA